MGQTLTRAAQWTRASDVGKGTLAFTPLNEAVLSSIVEFVSSFQQKHPSEAAVVFKSPLVWQTSIKLSDFVESGNYTQINDKLVVSKTVSDETDKKPLLTIAAPEDKSKAKSAEPNNTLSVYNFEELDKVLQIAKNAKLQEVRNCVEANSDPVANIFGDAFATIPDAMEDASVLQFMDQVISQEATQLENAKSPRTVAGLNKTSLRLLMLLQQFDLYMLKESIQKISKEIRLTPAVIEKEVALLKPHCGTNTAVHILEDIQFTSDVVSQFGCRTPLWRQFHGDICYLKVTPLDGPLVYVACNTAGVYVIKGTEGPKDELDYERTSPIQKDVCSLLREVSPHFKKMISSKEFATYLEKQMMPQALPRKAQVSSPAEGDKEVVDIGSLEEVRPLPPRSRLQTVKLQMTSFDLEPSYTVLPTKSKKKKQSETDIKKQAVEKMGGRTYWEKLNHLLMMQGVSGLKDTSDESTENKLELSEDSLSEESSESEEDEKDMAYRMIDRASTDMPADYWQVQKLIKYVKAGNQTGTVIAMIGLRDFNLTSDYCQRAIREMGGIELFINLLETTDVRCKIASLKILLEISTCSSLCRTIQRLGGLQVMVQLLHDDNQQVTALAAQNIAQLAKYPQVRRLVRQHKGVQQLVKLLRVDPKILRKTNLTHAQEIHLEEVRSAAQALWGLAISPKVRDQMRHAGAIPRLALLLHRANESLLIPVVGILQECLAEKAYQEAARKDFMIPDLVKYLSSANQELSRLAAYAIFRCAEDPVIRDRVRKYGGLTPLVTMLTDSGCTNNKRLLAAITGAIWKCAASPENAKLLQASQVVVILVSMLKDQPEEVLVNVVGALGECAQDADNRAEIQKTGGISFLINLLTHTNQQLLINVTNALKNCALDKKCIGEIDSNDGVRLLWSLLKHYNPDVQASAAWAICLVLDNIEDSGEMVRSFVGGLTLMVKLLTSNHDEVLASMCATLAIICKDEENLAVLTDNGMVPLLSHLTTSKNPRLRRYLAEAIAQCSRWGNNRIVLGQEGAIGSLVEFLHGSDPITLRYTCIALNNLSQDPANCITLHRCKVVDLLLKHMSKSDDPVLQDAASTCLSNVRLVGLISDKIYQARKQ